MAGVETRMQFPETQLSPSQQSRRLPHACPSRTQLQNPPTHSIRPQQSLVSVHWLPPATQHWVAASCSGERQVRPMQHSFAVSLQATFSRLHIDASRHAPAMHTSESQHSASSRQRASRPRHAHSPSTHSIAPQQSVLSTHAVSFCAQHCEVSDVLLARLHARPSQHSPLAEHSSACGVHIGPSAWQVKLWQVSPSQHSELSMQNEPVLPQEQVPSRQNMKPQQSSEFSHVSP